MKQRTLTTIEEAADSITLKRDAKGNYGWEIKIYFMPVDQQATLDRLADIDKALWEKYIPFEEEE